eukprot:TRINITY_DN26155_c0_g1_i1.p1 TRINITY_DN26155_c0_g1~~TRINITY_DN26155_c0_g1_i1.p1  ORF type:complete len:286 (+),score=70.79 TRINITY_DN26155_c0_g1_i1:87-944(+)
MYVVFFFFKQKTAYEMLRSLVGSEMCIRDSINAEYGTLSRAMPDKQWGEPAPSMEQPLTADDSNATLSVRWPSSISHPKGLELSLNDVVGARSLRSMEDGHAPGVVVVGCASMQTTCCGDAAVEFREVRYTCPSDQAADERAGWLDRELFRHGMIPAERRERKMVVILNPKGGSGQAVALFERHCRRILELASIRLEVLTTQAAGHAVALGRELELEGLDGILAVGGDGLMHELFQGLASRQDAPQALQVPIGHIPGGSGNGLAESICAASGDPLPASCTAVCAH